MANASIKSHSRIDGFLPTHDFSAAYEIRIDAPTYRLIAASIQWAERIMQKIDSQWPVNS